MSNPAIITYPAVEAISLEEARAHLRLDAYDSPLAHPDDPLVLGQIVAAREWAEKFTGRSILACVLEYALDCFPYLGQSAYYPRLAQPLYLLPGLYGPAYLGPPAPIRLPGGPVTALQSVIYVDAAGFEQVLTGVQFDTYEEPPRILPAPGTSWPATQAQMSAVRVRYAAGYSLPGDSPNLYPLPLAIKQAMLLVLGHLYETREDSSEVALVAVPLGAQALLRPYRLETALA
jgi:hypothetical protein